MALSTSVSANRLATYAGFVKLEHAVFSLPLVFAGTLLGNRDWPSWQLAGLILLAVLGARTAGMGLNRVIDREFDRRNPRTANRELPRGAMGVREAWLIVLAGAGVMAAAAAAIAPICLWLSPIPIVLFAGYPFLKRFTPLCHLGLGLAWSLAPLGGWVAVTQTISGLWRIGWLWLFSVLWVTGLDIIYATMDEAFDRSAGLHSLPARLGRRPALIIAAALHVAAFLALAQLWKAELCTDVSLSWLAAIGALFMAQHAVSETKPQLAFFHINALLGFLVFGFVAFGI